MKKVITSFFIIWLALAEPVLANVKPNDPYYNNEWYLAKIKADSAWDKISASPDTVIAVIDGRVDLNHPDLRNNIWTNPGEIAGNGRDDDHNGYIDDVHGWDFVSNSPQPPAAFDPGWTEAGVDHGTMVSGIIAAQGNNGQGVAGVTWAAKIMPLRVLNDAGEGKISNVIKAIDYAVRNGADIINLSFVSFNYSDSLQAAISRAHAAGVIIVAAAGNEQSGGEGYNIDNTPIYPACYDGSFGENMVIGVAATDALDQKTGFSSYGHRCVDITAPGISFFNTVMPGSDPNDSSILYDGYWSGTSMAAPLVTGAIALIEAVNPALTQREIVNILFASAVNIERLNPDYPGELGNGRLDVNRAVEMALAQLYSRTPRLVVWPVKSGQASKLTAPDGSAPMNLPAAGFPAGASVAAGDVYNNGVQNLVVGAPAGNAPEISLYTSGGKLLKKFLAFDSSYRGGVNLAVYDLDGDGRADIIAVPATNGPAEVRVFTADGRLKEKFPVGRAGGRASLNVAAGDLDGKGPGEIAVSYGPGNGPQVRIYDASGQLLGIFAAYEPSFHGGVSLAIGDVYGRADHGRSDLIVAPETGREPLVKIFDNHAVLHNQFLAYSRSWTGGLHLAAGDVNNDGVSEIIASAQPGAAPHIHIFNAQGVVQDSFYAWSPDWSGGVNAGIIQVNN